MGGDLTGKAIVPIASSDGAYEARLLGETRRASSPAELGELTDAIRFSGMYPWVASPNDIARVERDNQAQHELFERVMLDELARWIALADERTARDKIDCFVMAGNDDPWSCDEVLSSASLVQHCDERVSYLGPHEMISLAFSNPTPWNSPRELDEDALYGKLKALAEQLDRPQTSIFNLHVPPYDSGLDTANEINPDLTLVYKGGQPNPIPVGSTAVREIIQEYQPLVSLHGHIHESRGEARLGRTLALNAGSDYNSGQIHGVIVRLATDRVLSYQFVVG
jgi:Icc-related predicted phosphoesterase